MISYQAMTSPAIIVMNVGIIAPSLTGRLPPISLAPPATPAHTAASLRRYQSGSSRRRAGSASRLASVPLDAPGARLRCAGAWRPQRHLEAFGAWVLSAVRLGGAEAPRGTGRLPAAAVWGIS